MMLILYSKLMKKYCPTAI